MITRIISSVKMRPWLLLFLFLIQTLTGSVFAQQVNQKDTTVLPNGTDGMVFTPRKADSTYIRVKSDLPWNEFTGLYSTFKIGAGYIGDVVTHIKDDVFNKQMDSLGLDVKPAFQTRDFRILGSGRFMRSKRYLAYKFAYMYDGDRKVWMIRETGITIGAPELKGTFFVGRTKEGFSMIKVMNGHSGLTNERQMTLDPIPILADGIKYFGYFPKSKTFVNLGAFNDVLSKGQSFSTFRWQYVARAGWIPFNNAEKQTVLHIAGNYHYGKTTAGKFTVRSRPESNPTPQLINTGEFPADRSSSVGAEIYYSNKRFMIGSEVIQHHFYADKSANHKFQGGNVVVSFFLTNTHRPYYTQSGNIYGFVPVTKSVFKGGLGAIELVLHASTFNLNDGNLKGGKFTRFTPMINWYMSRIMRMEFIYGYGILDRLEMKGKVQFFESRIQFSIL